MKRIAPRFPMASLVLVGWLLMAAGGCGGHGSATVELTAAAAEGFSVQRLQDGLLDGAEAGELTLALSRQAAEVEVSIRVEDARRLKACYFVLSYEAERYDPLAARSTGLLSGTAPDEPGGQSSLELAVLTEPGTVHFGEVLTNYREEPGFSGDGTVATVRFAPRPFTPRQVSAPPVNDASRTEARWDPHSQALTWDYYCSGDYNQNGLVEVADLTPLGVHFGERGPFDPLSALAVIDGDSNGDLNVSDITPIGANFGRRVQGYAVYVAPNPASLPAANDEPTQVAPVGFVPFEDHLGNPIGERLRFAFVHPEPDPDQIVWVRPVDEELAGTPSTPQQPINCSWQSRNVSAFATVGASINYVSLAIVAGLPVVLYEDQDEQQLVFQRALDPIGQMWSAEVVVSASTNLHRASSVAEVAGRPAACHHQDSGELYFRRALDPAGAAWGEPQLLADTGGTGWDSHLWLVDGQPAVCYQDLASQELMYVRADDPEGEVWGAPRTLADLGSSDPVAGAFSSPAIIAGHPAIAFYHPGTAELRFLRALDPLGNDWDVAVTVASGTDVGRYASLCEVDGAPAVSFLSDSGLAFARAVDETGAVWQAPLAVDDRCGPTEHLDTSLAVVRGQPAISYHSGADSSDLLYVRALEPRGTIWGTPLVVDSTDSVGRSTLLVLIDGYPAISYLDETDAQVRYAICLDEVDFPPVALLDVYPSQAEVLEEITFDATRSYDPNGAIEVIDWDMDGDGIFEDSVTSEPIRAHAFDQPGIFLVRVRVGDTEGALSIAEARVVVGQPAGAPLAVLQADPLDVALGQAIHFDAADSSDPDGAIEGYEWDLEGDGDFETDTGPLATIDYEYSEAGIYNAAVKVTAASGLSDTDLVCINVATLNQRPVAVLTGSPTFGNPPFTVNLDGSQSYDPDGTIVRYEWDLNGDGIYEIDGGATASLNWLLEQPGDHRVKLRVTDNFGAQDSTWLLCCGNQPPTAKIAAGPTTGNCPFTVTLDGSGSFDNDGSIVAWGWDLFNDGSYEKSGTGPPTTWQFSMIWSGPVKVRLRVKDNLGAKGDAVVTIYGSKGWYVTTLDPVGWAGWYNSLADINGTPGIAYYEEKSTCLKYIRSSNPLGVGGWTTPMNLGTIADPGYYGYSVSLACIDGKVPGIGFYGSKSGAPSYVVAKNAQGTQWYPFVSVQPVAPRLTLGEVAGTPAIVADTYSGVLFYPADNDLGTKWKKPVIVTNATKYSGCECNLAIVNGNPAISCPGLVMEGGKQVMAAVYVRALDSSGSQWGVPVLCGNNVADSSVGQLAMIDGRPAMAYITYPSTGGTEVRYRRAANQNGTSWAGPTVLIKKGGREVIGLVAIDGKPAISLTTCSDRNVMYFQANDATGSSWPAGQVVDYSDQKLGWGAWDGSMISLGGHPAMSYYHSLSSGLKYAVRE